MASSSAESSVRQYLQGIKDPDSLIDASRISQLKKKITATDDPVERLQLQQTLLETQQPRLEGVEEAFVTHAKAWADSVAISADAFLAEGVDPGVLRRAGFRVAGRRTSGQTRRATKRTSSGPRVTVDQVRAAIPSKGSFTISDLVERTGASLGTVRKVVGDGVKAKEFKDLGATKDHAGPGRAPNHYSR